MKTLFYFNDISKLSDYQSFTVELSPSSSADSWLVVGIPAVKSNPAVSELPVAEFDSLEPAQLFANLCHKAFSGI